MTRVAVLPSLDPASYTRHMLHDESRIWVEKNCYIDIWIEVVHALGLDPMAMLPFVVSLDFGGDQWDFFKPSHDELYELYGLEVRELNVWRPLVDQVLTYLDEGTMVSTEADAFYLPDTSGTDYRRQHTKTTIVIADMDLEARRLGYFHNAAYHGLEGEDFVQLLRVGAPPDPTYMPLFAELIRKGRLVRRPTRELAALSRELLRKHLLRRPADNPVARFEQRFARDLPWIQSEGLAFYHIWAFATVRQLGAAFELASLHLGWLGAAGHEGLEPAARAFDTIAQTAKTFILKAARAVNAKRPLDAAPMFGEMASAWQTGMRLLSERLEA